MSDFNLYNWEENCKDGAVVTYIWEGSEFCWGDASIDNTVFCWGDVSFLLPFYDDATTSYDEQYEILTEEEKDKFVTLTCRVKGYPETKRMKRKVKTELSVEDIEFTVNEVLKRLNVTILKD